MRPAPGAQTSGYRIGIDVGGTFTDLICITPTGEVRLDKTPTTPQDQSVGVMAGIGQLAEANGMTAHALCAACDVVVHGTTTADNTMIEMDGANVGMLVTEGHRDEIEMRRVHKERIWDPSYPAPTPIARRRARRPIPERLDFAGNEVLELDEEAVRTAVRRLRKLGVDSVAVVFLFSYVNPAHEIRAAEIIAEEYPGLAHVSLSHEVMPRGPEFERSSTTLVNAYVGPRISNYVERLESSLRGSGFAGPLLLMQSTGGVMPPEYVAKRAVTLLGSGPTGGAIGAARAAGAAGEADFVAIDMGGTSFDICLVREGRPEVKADWNWRYRYYIGLPMVDVQCVGAGGGSIARVRQGALLVGPESAGSQPGPACYGRGGRRATVTDADAVLGHLPRHRFAGGRMSLDIEAARHTIEVDVAEPLGIEAEEAAWGITRIVNANMANATRRVVAGYGADPRDLAMVAYGGNGPVHAWAIAEELGIDRVLVPRAAPAFSALGLLVADYRVDVQRSHVTPLDQADPDVVSRLLAELRAEAVAELAPAGLDDSAIAVSSFIQMAYSGQNFDMSIPAPTGEMDQKSLAVLADAFHDTHEADRGFAFRNQVPAIRGVRCLVVGDTSKPATLAPSTSPDRGGESGEPDHPDPGRDVWWGEGYVHTSVYPASSVSIGDRIEGPALIEEEFTVVAVAPGWSATLADHSSWELLRTR